LQRLDALWSVASHKQAIEMTHQDAKAEINKTRLTVASHEEYDVVRDILDKKPYLVACMNALDMSKPAERPQGAAAHMGRRDILELMLERGVDLDIFMACALNRAQDVSAFLDLTPSTVNSYGSHKIPLIMHVRGLECVDLLVNRGAELNGYKEKRRGPLHHVARFGILPAVKLLVDHGADVNMIGQGFGMDGITPLAVARNYDRYEVAEYLESVGGHL
jgi:hypothetical protein